ncbi:MAG: initiation factor 2 [Firmicutes bacterium]|nr:initiation factor 2 [Bacillota bacterium]
MSKYRIYELAKEFNTTSKVIIDILARNNITAKNHMSSIDDPEKAIIDRTFARKTGAADSAAAKPSPSKPPTEQGVRASEAREPKPAPSQQQSRPHPRYQDRKGPAQPQGQQTQSQQPFQQNQQNQQRPGFVQRPYQPRPAQQRGPVASSSQAKPPYQSRPPYQNAGPRPAAQGTAHPPASGSIASGRPNQPARSSTAANQGDKARTTKDYSRQQRPQTGFGSRNTGAGNRNARPGSSSGRPGHRTPATQHGQSSSAAAMEAAKPKVIKLGGPITVKELASKLCREVSEIIKKLMALGIMATINQEVDIDTATILAADFGTTVEELPPEEDPTEIPEILDDPKTLVHRPPVVTVMGHVDHGKTSLLDAIRKANVTSHEAGGITQHIGAYQVNYQGKKIVFLDTPGHEAFTAMRARGAQVTDIAILVVAADDGVMPQTIEAINHAKSAKVPIIVAINKMDRPGANPDRVKQQLGDYGLLPEDWGGDTIMVPVSAYAKTGITDLLEMILLVAEMQELKANPNRHAFGTIIEAQLDKGRGPVATVLVQKGTLRVGDNIIAGTAFGKVRAMINERGDKVKKADPSTPVEVLGLSDVPMAGDILEAVDEKVARTVAEKRLAKKRTDELKPSQKVSLEDIFSQIKEGKLKEINIVLKADVQGSIEALKQSLLNLKNEEVRVNIVHSGAGAINESDVMLAAASNALIIGFNVRPDSNARKMSEAENIDIRTYRVIYDAINDIQAAITGMLAPTYKEVVQGRVEVRQIINIPKGVVAGSYVLEGKIFNSSDVRIIRNGIVIHEGKIESLRRFKDEVKEVAAGYECGISIEKFRDVKEGDIIEAFTMEEIKRV